METYQMRKAHFLFILISFTTGLPHLLYAAWGARFLWWLLTVGVFPPPRQRLVIGGVLVDRHRLVVTS